MALTRRDVLTAGGAAAVGATIAPHLAPDDLSGWAAKPSVAWAAGCDTPMPAPSHELHLLNRAAFGPTAAELAFVRAVGTRSWIEEQLNPELIDDADIEDALLPLISLNWTLPQLKDRGFGGSGRPLQNELVAATLYRAVKSKRQLFEVMVDHWSNQLNVFMPEEFISRVKSWEDRTVFRAHAMGTFREIVHGSSRSPAMLRYLDGARNTKSGPNENYARELMELHTIGPDGGYTEDDVKQVALCFTGWTYNRDTWEYEFRAGDHAGGGKTVLGRTIPSAGAAEGQMVIDLLVDLPACATHVARRLVRRFVADVPPEDLVARVAAAFGRDGDIKAMLRVLLNDDAFYAATHATWAGGDNGPSKIRRPLEQWVAVLRATETNVDALLESLPADAYEGEGVVDYSGRAEHYLQMMDHLPFRWRTPDGYPDSREWWGGMHVMISRWNFAMALTNGDLWNIEPGLMARTRRSGVAYEGAALVDFWAGRLLGRELLPADRDRLIQYMIRGDTEPLPEAIVAERQALLIALLFDSPYFQWR